MFIIFNYIILTQKAMKKIKTGAKDNEFGQFLTRVLKKQGMSCTAFRGMIHVGHNYFTAMKKGTIWQVCPSITFC